MFRFASKNHSFSFRFALVLGVVFATVLGATPAQAYVAVSRTTYIVQVKEGTAADVRAAIGKLGETPHDELTEVMDGFVLDMTDIEASTLRSNANVVQVVADQSVSLLDTQTPTPSWGLDRIDQTNTTYDSTYTYPASAGAGVRVYVVDTGVMASDPDFTGRVETGVDLLGQNLQGADCQGHGTHVAGTIAGTKYGVAKKATIVPVRVLSCSGSGSMSTIVSAIDWIIANNPVGTPAVMSASIGGAKYQLVNDAIEKLYQAGITPVIAAGNNNADAAGYSPASAPNAITVGASDNNDTRAYFSNYGDLVDVFAPGVNIVSDNYLDSTTGRVLSGTSMATPHVSGLAALYLADHKTATPAQVTAAIQAGAQAGIIVDAKSANGNYLINNKFTNAALPPVGAPTNVVVSGITATAATITWAAPTGTQAAASYKVEYKDSTATTWSSVDATTTTANLTGLLSNSTYSVRVSSLAGTTVSPASPELIFSTLADVPDAPTNLRMVSSFGTQINLAWDAPQNFNGSKLTTYDIWVDNNGTWVKKGPAYVAAYSLTGLTPSTAYSIRVTANNVIGASLPSATISASTTTATPAVVIFSALTNVTPTSANISWRAVAQIDVNTPITYKVDVKVNSTGTQVASYTTSALNQDITGLTRYTYYVINVTAYSGTIAGPVSSNYTFRTLADVPSAPTSLSAAKTTTGEVNLTWLSPRDGGGVAITQYKVEQFVAGAWTLIATNDVTVTNLVVPSPAAGQSEQYRVSAVNSIGTGPAAAITVAGTISAPSAPTGLTMTPLSAAGTSGALAWLAPTNNGGAAVTGYNIYRSADNGTTWTNLVNAVTTLTFNVALPPKSLTYLYAVVAVNSAGTSAKSTPLSYTSAATVPAAPAAPALSFNTDGTVKVLWVAPTDNGGSAITGYKVQRLVGTTWTQVATTTAPTTTANLARDAVGTAYSIRVIATNSVGDSFASAASNITIPADKSTAPLNLVATRSGNNVILTWQAPTNTGGANVTSYGVQVSKDGGTTFILLGAVNALTATTTAPPKGSTWQYRVFAVTSAGNSDFSNVVSVSSSRTAPGSPNMRSTGFISDGSLQVTWSAPSDDGGSTITGYRVEYSTDGITFATKAILAASVLSITIAREAPGVRAYVRVFTISDLGESPAGSTVSLATPVLKSTAPQNLSAVDSATYVNLTWGAPSNLGGATSVIYIVQVSKDSGATWLSQTNTTALSVNLPRPTKGTTWQYRVAANTAAGLSDYSNVVSVSVAATAPSTPTWSFVGFNSNGSIDLRWYAPSDNGGSAISGYTVQKSYDQINWSAVGNNSGSATSLNIPRENPGVRVYFRVSATNATATSAYSAVAGLLVPFLKATAPQNFTAVDATNYVTTSWSAPENLGGSTTVSYTVQVSKDNGTTFISIAGTTATTINVTRPTKGMTWIYRVFANTSYGASEFSSTANVAIAATAPGAPAFSFIGLNASTNSIDLRWVASSDNGGSALTSFVIQKSLDNVNFAIVATVSATSLSTSVARDLPGTRSYWRISATNALGASASSAVASVLMPYLQASAVQNFAATDNGSYVVTSWTPPADLGGSPSVYYNLQYSLNGGNTWLNYVSTNSLAYNIPRPAKGTTTVYRVIAVTAYGAGVPSQPVSISAAATAPSVPSIRSFVLNTDLTSTLVFNAPSDIGGSPLTGYVVEQSINGTSWTTLSTTAVAGTPLTVAAQAPGVRIYVRVSANNAIGASPVSSVYAVQMPFVQASAVQNLTINAPATSSYVSLTWAAPSNLGGSSSVSSYLVQATADGSTWSNLSITSSTSLNIARPAKGVTLTYRVLANTNWGQSLPSNTVSASTATTVASWVTGVVVTRQQNLSYNVSFNQPYDLGGIASWTYKIQLQQGSAWNTVLTGTGAATQVVNLPSPATNVYSYYRIIVTNSVGDSMAYNIAIRG